MHSVTAPLRAFDGLLDLERSRALHDGGASFGLEGVRRLVEALGPLPEPRAAIHVAGSEGKTTITERCAAGLVAQGLSVGSFTSPHLIDPLERMRIDLALPPADAVRAAVQEVLAAARRADVAPSWFEATWATARVLFARRGLDACVWETGLGGRLDATRLGPAHVCVISSISLEHTRVLGSTLAAVAGEKAGILRPGVPVVLAAELAPEARAVIEARARELNCPVHAVAEDDAVAKDGAAIPDGAAAGNPSARGVALSLAALEILSQAGRLPGSSPGERAATRAAVAAWRVAGRDELRDGVVYDGAHSVAAVEDLARRLARADAAGPVVLGVTHGRDAGAMARALRPVAAPLILTRVPGPRGLDPAGVAAELTHELADDQRGGPPGAPAARTLTSAPVTSDRSPASSPGPGGVVVEPDPLAALELARRSAPPGRRIVVTGSLYLVGHLLSAVREGP